MTNSVTLGVAYTDQKIVGGSIDNSPIGQATPAKVAVTEVTCPVTNVGTPGTGVVADEYGDSQHHMTILTLGKGCVLPTIAGGASLGVGTLLYTFPAGAQSINSSNISVGITQTQGHINANTPTIGLGTVIASGAVSVLSGTATFQNINVGVAAANCTGTPTVQTAIPTANYSLITDVGGVKALYFNAAAAWSASGDAGALLSGTVSVEWDTLVGSN
jgi:hypothetical protein